MTFEEFEAQVEAAVSGLPARFRTLLEKNEIAVIAREKVPAPVKRENRGHTVFGIFIGVPFGRSVDLQSEPTRIELYGESFGIFDDEEELRQEIRRTVVHEVAHYFGFTEAQIRKLGY